MILKTDPAKTGPAGPLATAMFDMLYSLVLTYFLTVMEITSELQMRMNALEVLIAVILMQLVTTLEGVTPALATVDTQAMDFLAHVSLDHGCFSKCFNMMEVF